MQRIIFDFDGTLIDSRQRLFKLFSFLIPHSTLSYEEYWIIKGNGVGHSEILKNKFSFNNDDILSFQKDWMKLIEDDKYLEMDVPFHFSTKSLRDLKNKGFDLVLLTARQYPVKVQQQLDNFNWSCLFSDILVTEQLYSKKDLLIKSNYHEQSIMMIGDTGYDIKTANDLNIFSVGVLTGFHSSETLRKYSPKKIVDSIEEIQYLC
jgi:phosphoglycolate phosphatase